MIKIRNPKFEIRNKSKIQNPRTCPEETEGSKQGVYYKIFYIVGILILGFGILIWGFTNRALAAESGLEERVRGVIKNYLVQKCPEWKEKRVVITFNQSDPTFKKIDNWGEIQKCEMVELSSSLRPAGVVALPIRFIDVAGRQQIALINTRVEIYDFAVVALKREKKGEALQISDLKLEERDVSLLGSRYFNDVLGMVGLIATTTIPQDSVIQPWMVKIPPLVTKGGRVSLLFCSPNVRVAVAGEVLDDAYLGQKVKVRRGSQKKTYEGTVVSSREVEVII